MKNRKTSAKKSYDFKEMSWGPNPYMKGLKKLITLHLDQGVVEYFKELSVEEGVTCQTLMNQFLRFRKEERLSSRSILRMRRIPEDQGRRGK